MIEWFTGFTDAEGSFFLIIKKGTYVRPIFKISLHIDDINILKFIQSQLKVGHIYASKTACSFRKIDFKDVMQVLIPIFKQYPLMTTCKAGQSFLKFVAFKFVK